MIRRIWLGYTTQDDAEPNKHLPKDEVEFITGMWFDSQGAMGLFAREE